MKRALVTSLLVLTSTLLGCSPRGAVSPADVRLNVALFQAVDKTTGKHLAVTVQTHEFLGTPLPWLIENSGNGPCRVIWVGLEPGAVRITCPGYRPAMVTASSYQAINSCSESVATIPLERESAEQTVQRTGASRFAQSQIQRQRRLAPVADLYLR
jgi:hypothetical protein